MNRSLRVFVSSTMRDLVNERDAVCQKLRDFNFEPVNAEGWTPSGSSSWEAIKDSLESSDVVLLLLGDKYGWVPDSGPMSELGLSVTHLEFREAKRLNIPILPFVKNLSYDSPKSTKDAKNRDAFRREVEGWANGMFVGRFTLARDLAEHAASAVVRFLTDDFLKSRIQARAVMVANFTRQLQARVTSTVDAPLRLPIELVTAVVRKQAVLIAGAGMSLAAGMPSAHAARAHLSQTFFPDIDDASHLSFAQMAAAVESEYSRDALLSELSKLLTPPQGAEPTPGHIISLKLFDKVITTNWDNLFEIAAAKLKDCRAVVQSISEADVPLRAIVKLHGSMSAPDTVIIEEQSLYSFADSHSRIWAECKNTINSSTPVLVGTSLHDPSVLRLLNEASSSHRGFIVVPTVDSLSRHRLRSWNLDVIEANSDQFFASLSDATSTVR